jgi:acyl carrier protein
MPVEQLTTAESIGARIRDYIVTNFLEKGARLDEHVPLGPSGILDSFSTMMLANFVEEEYGIVLDLEATPPSDLASVGAIASLISRTLRASA